MNSLRKFSFVGVSSLLFLCLAAAAAGDSQCESINTDINSTFSPCGINICTVGTISSGLLKGSTSFTSVNVAPGPAPNTTAYAGTLVVTTSQGMLTISDVGVLDTVNNVFSEVDRIESGSGIFYGAKGILFISGSETASGFTGKVTGNLCLQNEQ